MSISEEQKKLKKRLEDLERGYLKNPFTNDLKEQVELGKQKSVQEETSRQRSLERRDKQREAEEEIEETEEEEEIEKIPPKKTLKSIPHLRSRGVEEEALEEMPQTQIIKPSDDEIRMCVETIKKLKREMARVLVGQEDIVDGLVMGLLCDAHVLVEGVPGIAKTLAIRALASVSGCSVKRIQFTVDMLPTDIIGITNYTPEKGFEIIKGPIFTNFVIADEINRAPPKTQSALMEAMQEKQVTIGRKGFQLPLPFFVMATENPIENAGVYPLPEAQIDRFLFKLVMDYPKEKDEKDVLETNMTLRKFEEFDLKPATSPKEILKMQEIVKKVYLDDNVKSYIISLVRKTRKKDFPNAEYISYGSSPRASIGLFIASKARALMQGRNYVLPEDVKKVAFDVLRHRLILSYKANIQKISPDDLIKDILNLVEVE